MLKGGRAYSNPMTRRHWSVEVWPARIRERAWSRREIRPALEAARLRSAVLLGVARMTSGKRGADGRRDGLLGRRGHPALPGGRGGPGGRQTWAVSGLLWRIRPSSIS